MSQRSKLNVQIVSVALFAALMRALALGAEPLELARGTSPQQPQQPQVSVDALGAIHAVYGIGNTLRYRRSNDGGKTFTQAVDLPATHVISLGRRRGPRVATSDKAICVTVIGGQQGKGRDGDVLALHSGDGGQTWTGPVRVNDSADSAREGLHAMAASPQGEMCCTWLDLRHKRTEIMSSTSTDGGSTWSKNVLVYQSPSGSVCECCHPSVTFDSRGRIYVAWRNSLDGARDIYVASSADGGQTFDKGSKVGTGSWTINACPMDGGAIAVGGEGKLVSAWRREKSVYLSLDGEREERFLGIGEQPWIAASQAGPYIIWLKQRGAAAYLVTPNATTPMQLASHATDPVLAAGPNGRGPVVAAWESRDEKGSTIQLQVVSD